MTRVQKTIMATLGAGMVLLIYGMTAWKWGLYEMQGLFAGLTIAIAIIARMSPDQTAIEFSKARSWPALTLETTSSRCRRRRPR